MGTYKEQKEKKHNFVLIKRGIVLGTFGNLRKITNFMAQNKFPSYWTLIRIAEDKYPIIYKDYSIFRVKHY